MILDVYSRPDGSDETYQVKLADDNENVEFENDRFLAITMRVSDSSTQLSIQKSKSRNNSEAECLKYTRVTRELR